MEQEGKQVWTGPCIGGPLSWPGASVRGESRFPKGFVLVDMPNELYWIYNYDTDVEMFFVEQEEPRRFHKNWLKQWRDSNEYDIRTAEEEVSRVYAGTSGA